MEPTFPRISSHPASRRALLRPALRVALVAVAGAAAVAALPAAVRAAGPATTVTLKGKLAGAAKLLNPVWNEAKDPNLHRFTFREFSPTVRPDVRTLTAYLPKELCVVAITADKAAPNKSPLRVVLAGGRTSPVTLVVAEGQQIQFENQDPFVHQIYDTGNKGLRDEKMEPGKSRGWTPPGPGKYELRDRATPSLRSWIVVEPHATAIAYPDRQGNFAIDVAPAGTYKLRGYFNGEPVGADFDVVAMLQPPEQPLKAPLVVGDDKGGK